MRGLASFIMRGPLPASVVGSTALILSLLILPCVWIASAAISLYSLRRGGGPGAVVALGSLAGASALSWVAVGDPVIGASLAVSVWLPAWVLAMVLRVTVRLDLTLLVAGVLGVLLVLSLFIALGDPAQAWHAMFQAMLPAERVIDEMGFGGGQIGPSEWNAFLLKIAAVMTGFLGAAMVLNAVVGLLIARWWQALLFNPGGFGEEFRSLRFGRAVAGGAVAILALAWLTGGALVTNVAVVVVTLFAFQGLAVIHALVKIRDMSRGVLIVLYVLMFFAFVQVAIGIALVAIIDSWVDVRRRLAAKSSSTS